MKNLLTMFTLSATVMACGTKGKVNFKQMADKPVQCEFSGEEYGDYQKCDLSIKDSMVRVGDPKAEYKMVFLQGGPMPDEYSIKDEVKEQGKSGFHHWIAAQNVEYIYVRQAAWAKAQQYKNLGSYDVEDAKKETFETVERTNKIVKHFKEQGFTVILSGGSYGGFIMNEYINHFGTKDPDYIYQVVGRVDVKNGVIGGGNSLVKIEDDKVMFKKFDESNNYSWDVKLEIKSEAERKFFERYIKFVDITVSALDYDYTQVLSDKDLSKVTYINGVGDQHAGYMTQAAKDFVKSRGAKVVEFSVAETKAALKKYKEITGKDWSHGMGNTWKTAAHQATKILEEDFIKYVLEPTTWSKAKDYNGKVSFYPNKK